MLELLYEKRASARSMKQKGKAVDLENRTQDHALARLSVYKYTTKTQKTQTGTPCGRPQSEKQIPRAGARTQESLCTIIGFLVALSSLKTTLARYWIYLHFRLGDVTAGDAHHPVLALRATHLHSLGRPPCISPIVDNKFWRQVYMLINSAAENAWQCPQREAMDGVL